MKNVKGFFYSFSYIEKFYKKYFILYGGKLTEDEDSAWF